MDSRKISHQLSEEPTMSDKTIMLDIEDLISLTFGPLETNVVNFAMMQTVLSILARQMRFLEDDIEIKFNDDQEKIMTLMQHLQDGQGSSESEDIHEKEIFISQDMLEGYVTPDETGQYVESKAKKSEREKMVKAAKDLGTSEIVEDVSEIKGKKSKPKDRAKYKTPKTDDDDNYRSIDGQTDEPEPKKRKNKERAKTGMGHESSSLDRSEYSETKMEKKFEGKQTRKKVGETVESEGIENEKESAGKKERKLQKQAADKQLSSTDDSDDREDIEKKAKGTKEKATKKDKVTGDSQISDRPVDTRSEKGGEVKDNTTSQKRRTPEISSASGRSDEVGDRKSQKRIDEVSISGRSEDVAVKKDKISKDDQQSQPKKEKLADMSISESPKDVMGEKVIKSKDESQKQPKRGQISADSSIPDKSEDVREKKVKKSGDKSQSRSNKSKTPRDSSLSDDSEESGDEITFEKGDDKTDSQLKKETRSKDSGKQDIKDRKGDKSKSKTPQAKKGHMPADSTISDVSEDEIVSKHERSSDKRARAKKTEDTESIKDVQSKLSKSIPITSHLSEAERGETRKSRKGKHEKIEDTMKGKYPTATSSTTGIIVSEAIRKGGKGPKDKILVVEKGPTTRDSHPRIGKINVVPRPPFEALTSDVQKIVNQAGPLPLPTMPISQQLKDDLASGAATLTGTMQAMQLNTRVKAAETALTRMADILTQLAIEGTLPPDARDLVIQLQEERKNLSRIMSKVIPLQKKTSKTSLLPSGPLEIVDDDSYELTTVKPLVLKSALAKKPSQPPKRQLEDKSTEPTTSLVPPKNPLVTRSNLSSAIENMKNDMLTQMTSMTAQSTRSAEQATNMAKSIVERIEVALAVSSRIEDLKKFTTEQSELLSGFDSGLSCQLKDFKNQLQFMRDELQKGLDHLVKRQSIESSAVTSLREQHDRIELQMDETIHHHSDLVATYKQMYGEMKNLKTWVDLLREEKAERNEVTNGLKNMVNKNQLIGLLYEDEFEVSRKDLNKRLMECHDTFTTNCGSWMTSLNEIRHSTRDKANVLSLHSLKAYAAAYLTELSSMVERIESVLGDPELARLTRLLSGDGTCGSCRIPALMEPSERSYGLPPPMPALSFEDQMGGKESEEMLRPPDTRQHICKRWVGGSHTMFKHPTAVEKPQPSQLQEVPTKPYPGAGADGAMYVLEENLQGCVECNIIWKDELGDKPVEVGSGDLAAKPSSDQDPKEANLGDELKDNLSVRSTDRIIGLVDY